MPTPELGFSTHPGAYVPTKYIEGSDGGRGGRSEAASERSPRSLPTRWGSVPTAVSGNGWPEQDLLHFGDEKQADLIVVGARGLGVVARMAMGSVSGHLARHAPATLVARAPVHLAETGEIVEPDGDVSKDRYAVRWR